MKAPRVLCVARYVRWVQLRCGPLHLVLMLSRFWLGPTGRLAPWDWVGGPCPKVRLGPVVLYWWGKR